MASVSAEANVTHSRYGTSSSPAIRRTRQNATSVATISTHSSRISPNASAPRRHAKNSQVHSALASSWTMIIFAYALKYLRLNVDRPGLVFPGRPELVWRDYFRLLARRAGAGFFRRAGLRGQLPKPASPDPAVLARWTQGRTGNAFGDAIMRELAATGFMSNRGRQNAASYLIHDLRQDWRWGAAWFEHQLVDHDPASNWGNWKYIAGTGTDVRDTAFDIPQQARRYDPQGRYVRTWQAEKAIKNEE